MIFISAVSAENDKGTACAVMPVSKALWRIFDCGIGFRSPQWSHFSETPLPVNVYSSYSVCLSGRGRACVHAGRPLCPHPCGQPRSAVNASSIFSRTGVIALTLWLPVKSVLLFKQKTQVVRCGLVRLKIAAIVPLTRSQAVWFQRSDTTKVNGTFCQR